MASLLHNVLGHTPCSPPVLDYLSQFESAPVPEIKSYPDVVYYNFYSLGFSLVFKPTDDYKPQMGIARSNVVEDRLILESVDVYNIPEADISPRAGSKTKAEVAFAAYPISLIPLTSSLVIGRETTGKEIVQHLGEPNRKGGGSGPSSGSIGIWCEWTKYGVLVEFGGIEATGPQAWERGKDAVWKVLTVFGTGC